MGKYFNVTTNGYIYLKLPPKIDEAIFEDVIKEIEQNIYVYDQNPCIASLIDISETSTSHVFMAFIKKRGIEILNKLNIYRGKTAVLSKDNIFNSFIRLLYYWAGNKDELLMFTDKEEAIKWLTS